MKEDRNDRREKNNTPGQKNNPRTPQNEERRNREDDTVLKKMNVEKEDFESTTKQPDEVAQQAKVNKINSPYAENDIERNQGGVHNTGSNRDRNSQIDKNK